MRFEFSVLLMVLTLAACKNDEAIIVASHEPPAEVIAPTVQSDLIIDDGWELVQANCAACHSLSLVTQNHMTRSNWLSTIRWMQKKQGLWELGDKEALIVDYLEKNYGVADVPWRRKPLELEPLESD
jgi:hypothetical protein